MARLLIDLGREVEGIGTHDAARPVSRGRQGRAGRRAGRPAARLGAAARSAARAARPRAPRASGRRLSGAPHDHDASRGARAMGARIVDGRRPRPRGAGRPEADVDLSVRSLGDRNRDGAAGRGRGARASREIRHAACEPHVVELCEFLEKLGVGITGAGTTTIRIEGGAHAARRRTPAVGRLHRGGKLGGGGRRHRRRDRRPRRAAGGHGGGRRGAEAPEHRSARWTASCLPRRAVDAAGGRPHHDRASGPGFRATSSAW